MGRGVTHLRDARLLFVLRKSARAFAPSTPSWSGPDVKVVHRNGWPLLTIDGAPGPAQWLVPHSLDAGNASTPPYTAFDIQVAGAAAAGIRLVEMKMTGDCCIETARATGWVSDMLLTQLRVPPSKMFCWYSSIVQS